jgi:GNAT superfamily N-acetyltransferase
VLVLTHYGDPEARASVALALGDKALLMIGYGFFVSVVSEYERLFNRRRHYKQPSKKPESIPYWEVYLYGVGRKGEQTVEKQDDTRRPIIGPKNGRSVEICVTGLTTERLGEAAGLLARCFYANPNFVGLFPDRIARSRALPRVFAAGLRDASGFGHVYVAMRGTKATTGSELVGVAVWLPPGAFPLSATRQVRGLTRMAGVLAASPRSARRLLRHTSGMAALHPVQPHWYLEVVGVDPNAQGLGVGTRLLEPVLDLADEAGHTCYLETMTERNVGWYRRLGFEVREAGVRFVPGGPPNWTMMRLPRSRRVA